MSWNHHLPEQAAAIPYRINGGGVKICLIRRRTSDFWSVPKGTVEPGDTHGETAIKESWEEAGLRGRITGNSIGTYRYQKYGNTLTVAVYLMEVHAHEDAWDEAHLRERQWFSLREATEMLAGHPLQPLWERATRLLAAPPEIPRQT